MKGYASLDLYELQTKFAKYAQILNLSSFGCKIVTEDLLKVSNQCTTDLPVEWVETFC